MIFKFLIISKDNKIFSNIKNSFQSKQNSIILIKSKEEILKKITSDKFDIVLLDLNFPNINSKDIILKIRIMNKDTAIIAMTEYGSIQTVDKLFALGVNHFIFKPFEVEEIYYVINNLIINKKIQEDNIKLKQNLSNLYKPENLIGESKCMQDVYKMIIQVAEHDVSVVIQGESGTGKEVVAKAIHFSSRRKNNPFYAINCGAIPDELLESELFGHKKGAFTHAVADRKGLFEEAFGSTLFLDEIAELPLKLQPKLLRALQEKKIKRVGDNEEIETDFKLIAATSKKLNIETANKRFREDLYYRLNVLTIHLPSLRERKEDIPLLIHHFIEKYNKSINKNIKGISKEALTKCMNYNWPGNVRELENFVQRAMVLTTNDMILPENIVFESSETDNMFKIDYSDLDYHTALKNAAEEVDKIYIKKALIQTKYNKVQAAKKLSISARTLHYKIKELFPDGSL